MAVKSGSTVTLDYKVFVNGELIDQTSPGQPLVFTQGAGQIIPGLERAIVGLDKGDKKEIVVQPDEAYGEYSEERVMHIPKEDLPADVEPQEGMQLQATTETGDLYFGVITEVKSDHIDVDFNHPLAGKTLKFEIEVQDVQE